MDAWDIKTLFKISPKARHDSYTDQYNRIFMVKLLLVCSLIIGINWYDDKINCSIPKEYPPRSNEFVSFVQSACWMQGLYVYQDLSNNPNITAFFGLPVNIANEGMVDEKHLCEVQDDDNAWNTFSSERNNKDYCVPLKKTFYLQYQWMPFYIGSLAIFYYLPFIIFAIANRDIIQLARETEFGNASIIMKRYFDIPEKKKMSMFGYFLCCLLIKLLYVGVNITAFFSTDYLLDSQFLFYIPRWIEWAKFDNSIAYDYMGARNFPKPGNRLLPPFGYCEVYSSSKDELYSHVNKHKYVCELSQHILYQYMFILLWIAFVIGIIFSIAGLLFNPIYDAFTMWTSMKNDKNRSVFMKRLNYRQREYLKLLKDVNINLYDEVLVKIIELDSQQPLWLSLHRSSREERVTFSQCNGDVQRRLNSSVDSS